MSPGRMGGGPALADPGPPAVGTGPDPDRPAHGPAAAGPVGAGPVEAGDPGRRPRRRALVAGGIATALLVGGAVAVAGGDGDDGGPAGGGAAASPGSATAAVERRTLEERVDLDGTLGYGEAVDVSLGAQGTITGLAPIGSVVDRGQTLLELDGRPVPLLFGARPQWRELRPGVEDGADVEQLEANLVALGVVTDSELTVDQDWTSATTGAVREWQEALGVDDTGTLPLGAVVFQPGAVRVAEHPVAVGGAATEAVIAVTGNTRQVTIDLEATRQALVRTGQAVTVVLPDGTDASGTVGSIGTVATADDGEDDPEGEGDEGDATVEVVVALDDPAATGTVDQAPVTVRVVTSAATDVLAVPVAALLALAEGGYAVDLQRDDGTTALVPVELGAFADGWVEVTGDVAEGDEVVVPGD